MKMMKPTSTIAGNGPNAYNAEKPWSDEGKTGQEFVSADDSMAYNSTPKTVVIDSVTPEDISPIPPGEVREIVEQHPTTPYDKVDYKKRYDDLRRHHNKKVEEFKTKEADLKKQINEAAPSYKPPTSAEELAEWKELNGDLYNVVETVAHMQTNEEMKALQEQLKEVQEKLLVEEANRAYAELKTLVPDFEQVRASEEFHLWAEKQPKEIQDWIYNNSTNVQLAARAINLYKAETGAGNVTPPPAQPDRSAAEMVQVKSRQEAPSDGKKIWTNVEIGALSPAQFDAHRDEIDQAFAEGRVRMV